MILLFCHLNSTLKVKKVEIEGINEKIPIIGLRELLKHNLLFINKDKMENQIEQENPLVKEAKISKVFPDKIKVNITLYNPEVVLQGDGVYFYLSDDGRILYKSKNQDKSLPIIYYYQKLSPYIFQAGDWIDYYDIKMAIKIKKIFSDLGIIIERVDIKDNNMIVFMEGKKNYLFSTEKDLKILEYQLIQIVKRFRIEAKEFTILDLRFDKAIVKF